MECTLLKSKAAGKVRVSHMVCCMLHVHALVTCIPVPTVVGYDLPQAGANLV